MDQLAQNGETCIFCSYEMARLELYSKTVASEIFKTDTTTTLTSADIRQGAWTSNLDNVISDLQTRVGVKVLELTNETVDDLLDLLKQICRTLDNPPVICLDYLQIIPSNERDAKRGIDDIVRKLKIFQRETNTTFIVVSSFNRTNYNLSVGFESFKESGGIEYSADVVWGLQLLIEGQRNHESIEQAKKEIPRQIQLKCLKNRNGKNYDVGFFYYPQVDLFELMEEYESFTDYKQNENGEMVEVNKGNPKKKNKII